ncbi:MAG: glycosyltransferase, partial [Candidatus Nezhaarchaeales archaeon]
MSFIHALVLVMFSVVYVWTLYQLPILAIGVSHLRRYRNVEGNVRGSLLDTNKLPTISIIVPVKDEEKVVGRLLEALLKLDYPPEKREIVIVEDGSKDRTVEICEEYVKKLPGQVKLIHKL